MEKHMKFNYKYYYYLKFKDFINDTLVYLGIKKPSFIRERANIYINKCRRKKRIMDSIKRI